MRMHATSREQLILPRQLQRATAAGDAGAGEDHLHARGASARDHLIAIVAKRRVRQIQTNINQHGAHVGGRTRTSQFLTLRALPLSYVSCFQAAFNVYTCRSSSTKAACSSS